MCLWVRAIDVYGRMVKVVEPKRQALRQAEAALAEVEAQLAAKRGQLRYGAAYQSVHVPSSQCFERCVRGSRAVFLTKSGSVHSLLHVLALLLSPSLRCTDRHPSIDSSVDLC